MTASPPTGDTAPLGIALDALRLIAGYKCRNYTGGTRCYDEGWGRTRGAQYSAEAWCDACIAQDALTRAAVSSSSPDDTAPAAIAAALALHQRGITTCTECRYTWPCPTVRALQPPVDGDTEETR